MTRLALRPCPRWRATTPRKAICERPGGSGHGDIGRECPGWRPCPQHAAESDGGRVFPAALVTNHQVLIVSLELPDPDDRHVLAAALQTKAAVIVTENLRGFPAAVLSRYDIEAVGLYDFIADIVDLAGWEAVAALRVMREGFRQPSITAGVLIRKIEQLGLTQTADLLTDYEDLL
ncbi:MAG: PIN domain-containing protein [Pseudomonadota bacterium]